MSLHDFQVVSRIGDGSNSSVFKVKRIKDQCIYALKKVRLEEMSQKQIQNAINQVRFLASIRHPNVIAYKEAFFDINSRCLCIVMEYADGGDLLKKIFQFKRKGHHFEEEYVWDIFVQVVKGLKAIHQLKIAHRDLKVTVKGSQSANIYLTNTGLAKIGDFDVSTVLGKGMMCQTQTGTPYYASPEVWRDESYNWKADMWSLGCILFEILHLKPAFRARDKETLFKKVNKGYFGKVTTNYSEDFGTILALLLETNPYERISCKELLRHPILKEKMKKGKVVQSLESSFLLKTIRPAKNMNYLTEKLPKPNYCPVRYRSFIEYGRKYQQQVKFLGGSMQQLPKGNSLLAKSHNFSTNSHDFSSQSLKKDRSKFISNPEWLPNIPSKRSRNLH